MPEASLNMDLGASLLLLSLLEFRSGLWFSFKFSFWNDAILLIHYVTYSVHVLVHVQQMWLWLEKMIILYMNLDTCTCTGIWFLFKHNMNIASLNSVCALEQAAFYGLANPPVHQSVGRS